MKKLLLILLLSSPCLAGSKYSQKDPLLQDEIENIYKDIDNVLKGDVRISGLAVSTITVTSATIVNLSVTNVNGLAYLALVAGQLPATATNDDAAAGKVGEYISASVDTLQNSPATATWGDIVSMDLTAGDWDVYGACSHNRNTATWSQVRCGVGSTSGNNPPTFSLGAAAGVQDAVDDFASSASNPNIIFTNVLPARVTLNGTDTIYLKVRHVYSVNQSQYMGSMWARRAR